MASEFLTQGIEPGGLTTSHETRSLICYLFRTLKSPLTAEQVNDILQEDGLVNYFELSCAVKDLTELGHLSLNDDGKLSITEKGIEAAKTFERTLPFTVKEKAVKAGIKLLAREKRDSENKVELLNGPNGCVLNIKMLLDRENDLLNLSLFMPDRAQAQVMKDQFLSDPELFYKGVLALLTGDMKTVGELIPSENAKYYKD